MLNKYKNDAVKKRQAIRGERVKKCKPAIALNRVKEWLVYIWHPKLITGLSVLLVGLFVYKNTDLNQLLPVQSVKIEGEFVYLDKNRLREQTIPVVSGGFFNVDLQAIRKVDKLLVRVIEKKPVVLWGKKGVISARGELFEPVNKPDKSMLQELARMQAWLIESGLYIERIDLNARRSWTLTMTSGMELRLGRKQMHERLNRFVSVYKETLEVEMLKKTGREIKHIDMRYTNGLAVAWKEA